jgi:hypothetical protein
MSMVCATKIEQASTHRSDSKGGRVAGQVGGSVGRREGVNGCLTSKHHTAYRDEDNVNELRPVEST